LRAQGAELLSEAAYWSEYGEYAPNNSDSHHKEVDCGGFSRIGAFQANEH